jgi:Rrf2 family protein
VIKLNRTTEYGLVALRHMTRKRTLDPTAVTSAREVADCYGLPFEITAKTLQRLKDTGLIQSEQGARGGYTISADLNAVNLAEFLKLLQGKRSLVVCSPSAPGEQQKKPKCEYHSKCEIRGLMENLNSRVVTFLSGIRLADVLSFREEGK